MSTYLLYSDTAQTTALDSIGAGIMGTQDTELLKQIFVAAGNGGGGAGGAYLPLAGGTMTGDITLADGVNIVTGSTTGTTISEGGTSKLSFFGAAPITQPVVTGARIDPEGALLSLLGQLAALGIIDNQTTDT